MRKIIRLEELDEVKDDIWEFNLKHIGKTFEVIHNGKFIKYVKSYDEFELLKKQYQRIKKLKNIL